MKNIHITDAIWIVLCSIKDVWKLKPKQHYNKLLYKDIKLSSDEDELRLELGDIVEYFLVLLNDALLLGDGYYFFYYTNSFSFDLFGMFSYIIGSFVYY